MIHDGTQIKSAESKKLSHGWLHFVVITAGPHIVVSLEDQRTWNASGQTNWSPGVDLAGG